MRWPLALDVRVLRRAASVAMLVALPLAVGLVAGVVLDGLSHRQRIARDARLVMVQLRETVGLQEALVSHAMMMGRLTADLPDRLEQLRAVGNDQLMEYRWLIPSTARDDELGAAWAAYVASVDRRMAHLSDAEHRSPMTPAGEDGPSGTDATTARDHAGPAPADAATDHAMDHDEAARAPEAERMLGVIDDIDRTLRRQVKRSSDIATRGTVATAVVAALVLTFVIVLWQVTRSRRAAVVAEAERRSEARFRSLVHNATDAIVVVEPDTAIAFHTPSADRMLAVAGDRLTGSRLVELVHADEQERFVSFVASMADRQEHSDPVEFRLAGPAGWVHVELMARNLLDDPSVNGLVLTARDVTERKALEDQLLHQAFHDDLTGLPNRKLFIDRVSHALERNRASGAAVSVLFCDLDNFKEINDTQGHALGDHVLTVVGDRLPGALRSWDTAARLGGDEFAVLLEESDTAAARQVAERLLVAVRRPISVDGREIRVDASIGIATRRTDELSADELLRDADLAMYLAKDAGKGHILAFEPHMHDHAHDQFRLKTDLQGAVDRGELRVHYQPTIVLSSGEVAGLEALVRWQHPERGLVAPAQFIPLAEETGIINAIGGWVLERACADAVEWQRRGHHQLQISVNVSTVQLRDDAIVDQLRHALRSSGLAPASLTLELTESAVADDDPALIGRLHALKGLGVRLAIDDFGIGYSSLGYLATLPVDIVKVDRSFISPLQRTGSTRTLVATIIEMARTLQLQTVAEGIEKADQAAVLRELGCEIGQGYLFAHPTDADGIDALLSGRPSDRQGGDARASSPGPSDAAAAASR